MDHQGSGGNNYDNKNLQKYALAEKAVDATGQLYNLSHDPGEENNLFFIEAEKRQELQELLQDLKTSGRSAPLNRQPLGIKKIKKLKVPF